MARESSPKPREPNPETREVFDAQELHDIEKPIVEQLQNSAFENALQELEKALSAHTFTDEQARWFFVDLCTYVHKFSTGKYTEMQYSGEVSDAEAAAHRDAFSVFVDKLVSLQLTDAEGRGRFTDALDGILETIGGMSVIDRYTLAQEAIDHDDGIRYLIAHIKKFDLTQEQRRSLFYKIIETADTKETVEDLVTSLRWGGEGFMHSYMTLDHPIVTLLLQRGFGDVLVSNLGKIDPSVTLNQEETLILLKKDIHLFLMWCSRVHKNRLTLNTEVVAHAVRSFFELNQKITAGTAQIHEIPQTVEHQRESWKGLIALNEESLVDTTLHSLYQLFGNDVSFPLYAAAKDLERGTQVDWIEELVDASDRTTGLTRLEHAVANFNQHLLTRPLRDEDIRDMLSKPIHRTLFKRAIRYESSEWGSHDDAGLDELVARYFSYKADGRLAPLSPEIVGGTIAPNKRARSEVRYGKNFLEAYETNVLALAQVEPYPTGTKGVYEEFKKVIYHEVLPTLEETLTRLRHEEAHPQRLIQLEKSIEMIRASQPQEGKRSSLHTPRMLERALIFVANLREETIGQGTKDHVDRRLRELLLRFFAWNGGGEAFLKLIPKNVQKPEREELSSMISFVNHHLLQEFLEKRGFLSTREGTKAVRRLFGISTLEEQFNNWKDEASIEKVETRIVPSRDLLTELSGHMGDACWASLYPSICLFFPNITSYRLVQNPENEHVRTAGAFLTIDTINEYTGRPVMVIRGLNPIENYINQLNAESFLREIVAYLAPIAERRNMDLAIVIDDHAGGAGTNRPALQKVLEKAARNGLQSVATTKCRIPSIRSEGEIIIPEDNGSNTMEFDDELVSRVDQPTIFNSYNTSNDTYLIEVKR